MNDFNFNYIKKEDLTKELFYKIPKQFILEDRYKKMKDSSKILYSILKERTNLSLKNNWLDEDGYVYIICTYDEIQVLFNCSRSKVSACIKDLKEHGLLKQGSIIKKENEHDESEEGKRIQVLYIAHAETTQDTLSSLLKKHNDDYRALRNEHRNYKREYDKKQQEAKSLKRAQSENQTTIENTKVPRVEKLKASNFNRSPKIRLRVVRKSDYNNTNTNKTENISMYVCTPAKAAVETNNTFLEFYEKHLVASKYIKKVLGSIEEEQKISYELFETVLINALNNKKISNHEKWIVKTINELISKGIKTVEEYDASIKEFSKKYTKSASTKTTKAPIKQIKTRHHQINQTFGKYGDKLEEVLQESQKGKFTVDKRCNELVKEKEDVTVVTTTTIAADAEPRFKPNFKLNN